MQSAKMVRCFLEKVGNRTLRFIPFHEFELWKYMMQNKHGFLVTDVSVSIWVDFDEYERLNAIYEQAADGEAVLQLIFFVYSDQEAMHYQVVRYVPMAQSDTVKEILLKHFAPKASDRENVSIEERPGFWLGRR